MEDSRSVQRAVTEITSAPAAVHTMSSLQIAEITGKNHADVIRDIRNTLEQAEVVASKFAGYYIAPNGKKNPCYNLPRRECDLVISGYSMKQKLKPPDSRHLQRSPEISGHLQRRLQKVERWSKFLTFRK